jgi:hypothetical protein
VTNWIRAAGLSNEYRPCYTAVAAAGKRADSIAARLGHGAVTRAAEKRKPLKHPGLKETRAELRRLGM